MTLVVCDDDVFEEFLGEGSDLADEFVIHFLLFSYWQQLKCLNRMSVAFLLASVISLVEYFEDFAVLFLGDVRFDRLRFVDHRFLNHNFYFPHALSCHYNRKNCQGYGLYDIHYL